MHGGRRIVPDMVGARRQTLSRRREGRVRGNSGPGLTHSARRLRRDGTHVERLLWARLRGRRLNGWKFPRQFPVGRFVVDFCCPDAWLIIDLDGGQHGSERGLVADRARTRELESCVYLVQRFWNAEIVENLDNVCEAVLNLLRGAPPGLDEALSPSPQPSPHRGEGARGRSGATCADRPEADNPLRAGESTA